MSQGTSIMAKVFLVSAAWIDAEGLHKPTPTAPNRLIHQHTSTLHVA
jgi:hypothetical protein